MSDSIHPCQTWDRLLWLDGLAMEKLSRPKEPDDVVRCRERIDSSEQALETVRTDPFVALFGFHDDLEKRRARWAHLHAVQEARPRRGWPIRRIVIAVVLAAAISMFFSVFGLFALLLAVPFEDLRHAREEEATFEMSACPDCQYDLTGVPAAIPVERVGLETGPRACPECGCAWPLVPPPA